MDIDLLKSTPDNQIEMMLMMHMDKSSGSDLSGPYVDSPMMMSFSGHHVGSTTATSSSMAQLFDAHQQGHLNIISPTGQHNPLALQNPFGNNNNGNGNGNGNGSLFHALSSNSSLSSSNKQTSMAAMREMIFRIAAMQPIYIDPESVKPPKRRNVRISKDPQSVAARHRRERISERIRILQRLVPGGTKMDTASMLDEAIHYVKFLKTQVQSLERVAVNNNRPLPVGFPVAGSSIYPVTGGKGVNNNINTTNYSLGAQVLAQNVHQFSDA